MKEKDIKYLPCVLYVFDILFCQEIENIDLPEFFRILRGFVTGKAYDERMMKAWREGLRSKEEFRENTFLFSSFMYAISAFNYILHKVNAPVFFLKKSGERVQSVELKFFQDFRFSSFFQEFEENNYGSIEVKTGSPLYPAFQESFVKEAIRKELAPKSLDIHPEYWHSSELKALFEFLVNVSPGMAKELLSKKNGLQEYLQKMYGLQSSSALPLSRMVRKAFTPHTGGEEE